MENYSYLHRNLEEINKQISNSAQAAGRTTGEITLMSAVKSAEIDEINYIHKALGISHIGENRVQQLLEHYDKLEDRESLKIHFIGSLQTNKVKYIIDKVYMIHSLDSDRLACEINKQAKKKNLVSKVLVEINSGNEESKGGIDPSEASDFCLSLAQYENIELCGFMTMAPRCDDKSLYFGYFNKTRELALDIWSRVLKKEGKPILSMGMSESFCQAIECGADIVRVGRGMFVK